MAKLILDLTGGERLLTPAQVSQLTAWLAEGCEHGLKPKDCARLAASLQLYIHAEVKPRPVEKSRCRRQSPPPSNVLPFPPLRSLKLFESGEPTA